ncbi:MAG: uracil-DNA glycosylase [Pseudomonadota bacterium]
MPTTASSPAPSTDWPTLRAQIAGCTHCKLCKTRTNTVFGVGNPQASLMVVGEGPGADEDASGEPFVGRAGKLLDEMLKAINRSRAVAAETPLVNAATLSPAASESVFIANVVKCRPPGNRDPEKDEVDACRGYLDAQIAYVKPKMIVALGRIAAQRLLGNDEPLSRLRGPIHHYGALKTPVFVTYHPAYLLRAPKEKAKSWEDLKKIAQFLKADA